MSFNCKALHDLLTPTEIKVIALASTGISNAKIAGELERSILTIKKHMTNIFKKLGVCNRTQAIIIYLKTKSK